MPNQRFLISRTDNIGDVVLTLPIAAELKKAFPTCFIAFLARDYVNSVVETCPFIDKFISWDALDKLTETEAVNVLSAGNYSTLLHVFPRKKIARLGKKAKIPTRIGTSHRLYHFFTCNKKVNFSRTKSKAHEAILNFSLLKPLGIETKPSLDQLRNLECLHISSHATSIEKFLDHKRFNLILHPLSNGNGRQWPLNHYQQLIEMLDATQFNILITGSAKERDYLQQSSLGKYPHLLDACGMLNLNELLQLIHASDGLVASGTGPLHIAAALGTPTLGLFPPAPNINPQRWAPIGKHASYLVAETLCSGQRCSDARGCPCMEKITVSEVIQILQNWQQQKSRLPQENC